MAASYRGSYLARQTNAGESKNYYIPSSLSKLYVAKGTIDTRALANMTSLTDLVVSDEVKKINQSAFAGCDNLVNLSVPFISKYEESYPGDYYETESENYEIKTNGSYPWKSDGNGMYHSGNYYSYSSSSSMTITFKEAGTFNFQYRVSSRSGDYLSIQLNGLNVTDRISGYYSSYFSKSVQVKKNDVLTITYDKNSSYYSYDDRGYFNVGKFMANRKGADIKYDGPQVLGNYFEVLTSQVDHYTNASLDSSFINFPADDKEGYTHQFSSYTGKSEELNLACVKHYYYKIPSTLRSVAVTDQNEIPAYAFNNCSSLTSIDIKNASLIGAGAFRNCASITEVNGSNITTLGVSSFEGCASLLRTPDFSKIGEIPASTFRGCTSLTDVDFTGVTSIGDKAFNGCTGITEIDLPVGNLTSIGKAVFGKCGNIAKVKLDFGENYIESFAIADLFGTEADSTFDETVALTEEEESDYKSVMGPDDKYYYIPVKLTAVEVSNCNYLPENLCYGIDVISFESTSETTTSIAKNAFKGCSKLTHLTIASQNIDYIGESAFEGCSSLERLGIPSPVHSVSISTSAFKSCSSLVTLPDMVINSLGDYAFEDCSSLIATPDISQLNDEIGAYAFKGCSLLSTITLSEQLQKIDTGAFSGCSSLVCVNSDTIGVYNLPDSIVDIGSEAFAGCNQVRELHVPFVSNAYDDPVGDSHSLGFVFSSNPYDGSYAVEQPYYQGKDDTYPSICRYYIPNGLTKLYVSKGIIETHSLGGMTSLTDLIVGNDVSTIKKSAFAGCNNLVNLSVPFISGYEEDGIVPSTAYTISNSSYAWTLNDGVYQSGNRNVSSSSSTMSITFTEAGTFTFRYRVSSESGCDRLSISLNSNNIVDGISGETAFASQTIEVNPDDVLQISYSKDGSVNSGSDCGYFAIDSFAIVSSRKESSKVLGNYFDIITQEDDDKIADYDDSFVDETVAEMEGYVCQYSSYTGTRTTNGKRKLKNYYYGIPSTLRSIAVTNQPEIPAYSFNNCSSLTSIQVDGATKVGEGSFRNCSSISAFSLENVNELGSSAFEGCSGLLSMPEFNQVDRISDSAFKGCTSLTELNLGAFSSIGNHAFQDCASVTDVNLDGVISLGNSAFEGCTELTSLSSLSAVQTIGCNAFKNCSSLTDVVLSDTLSSIGDGAFSGCSGLTDIHSLENVVTIGNNAFEGCTALLSLPESTILSSIGNGAFKNCASLTKIPSYPSLTHIGDEAFEGLTLLTDIGDFGNLTSIGARAFFGCTSIQSLDFPSSLSSIGMNAFGNCHSINSVSMPFDASKTFYDLFGSDTEFEGSIEIEPGDETIVYVPQALNSIHIKGNGGLAPYAFKNAKHITSITMDDGIQSIGNNAFENCTGLTELDLPESITTLGNEFLIGCSGLISLKLPFVENYIGQYFGSTLPDDIIDDFYEVNENSRTYYVPNLLADLTIKSGEIKSYACANLTKIVTLTIGDSVTLIDRGAFSGCSSLAEIRIPFVGRTESEEYGSTNFSFIFGNSEQSYSNVPQSLRKVTVTKQTWLRSYAFYGCKQIEEIVLSDDTISIGSYAFYGCSGLKRLNSDRDGVLNIPQGVSSISDYAFYGCSLVQEVTLSDDVTAIGSYAFYNCNLVSKFNSENDGELIVPSACQTIGSYAFSGMGLIVKATVGDQVTSIGLGTFSGCSSLAEIRIPFIGRTESEEYGSSYRCFSYIFGDSAQSYSNVPQSLKKVTVTKQTSLPSHAFYGCAKIEEIVLSDDMISIGHDAFNGCSGLKRLNSDRDGVFNIPQGVSSISDYAFSGCSLVQEVTLSDDVTSIGNSAFYNCNLVSKFNSENDGELIVPSACQTIGSYAFSGMGLIVKATIADSVTAMEIGSFRGVSSLAEIALPFVGRTESATGDYRAFCYIFGGSSVTQSSSVPQSLRKVTVTKQTSLPSYAFYGCGKIEEIVLSDDTTSIDSYAFNGCKQLERIVLSDDTISIGSYAFYGCSGLKRLNSDRDGVLNIPQGVSSISDYAFYGCSLVQEVTLSDDVTSIGSYAFYNCNLVSGFNSKDDGNLVIPSSCKTIGDSAFYGMGLIVKATVGDQVTSIGLGTFSGCSTLSEITIPFVGRTENETSDYRAFCYIFGGSSVTQSSSVPQSLRKVTVTKQTSLPSYAFYGCKQIEEIHLISGYTAGSNAFSYCKATILTDVIPTSSAVYDNSGSALSYHGGDGTVSNPYQIFSCQEFLLFLNSMESGDDFEGKAFVLTSDLDFGNYAISDTAWTIFKGTFNGNGHVIKSFSISYEDKTTIGLFGLVDGGEIKNVGFENVKLNFTTTSSERHYIGAIVGELNNGVIENVYVKGSMTTSFSKDSYVGGIVGHNNGKIKDCYSDIIISSTSISGKSYAGGLVGLNDASIEGSFAVGNITSHGYAQAFSFVGGLVGDVGDKSTIENCHRDEKQVLTRFTLSGDFTNEYGDIASFNDLIGYCKSNWSADWKYIYNMYPMLVKKSK